MGRLRIYGAIPSRSRIVVIGKNLPNENAGSPPSDARSRLTGSRGISGFLRIFKTSGIEKPSIHALVKTTAERHELLPVKTYRIGGIMRDIEASSHTSGDVWAHLACPAESASAHMGASLA